MSVPELRVSHANDAPIRAEGDYVLYWMIAQRRVRWNFALDRAVHHCRSLGKPLVILEPLRVGYPWASARMHRFVIEGMASNARRLAGTNVRYYAYVEPEAGAGKGLLETLAGRASVVVTDDYPAFFLPRMLSAAAARLPVRLEKVDSNGLLPLRAADKIYKRAVDFRRFLQKTLAPHLGELPAEDPLAAVDLPSPPELPPEVLTRWPSLAPSLAAGELPDLGALPIDASVAPVAGVLGGGDGGDALVERFLDRRLHRYGEDRNAVVDRATSELSAHLHFGHTSTHQVLVGLAKRRGWDPGQVAGVGQRGARLGWWGLDEASEGFLDELVTWRELGFNMAWQDDGYDRYGSLPEWARRTLEEHEGDPRPEVYDLGTFEAAETHDEIWNAAQRELLRDGRIHNYLRMLWGKKILEWSATPRDALATMIELNNKYALDGRDPNSYSGIFWCLGRYDRAWGPERPIFGKVRFMSSDSTRRKMKLAPYLEAYGA
ncbi:MAG: deoxyribodipyrimidine photolyase [Acidobacteriota bacterium]